jgi:hypothetical protein
MPYWLPSDMVLSRVVSDPASRHLQQRLEEGLPPQRVAPYEFCELSCKRVFGCVLSEPSWVSQGIECFLPEGLGEVYRLGHMCA